MQAWQVLQHVWAHSAKHVRLVITVAEAHPFRYHSSCLYIF